jgi:AraC family transcriptional regulator
MAAEIENRSRFLRDEYISRINRVLDYIETNISGELSLIKLSRVASFSPFHFHRIFRAIVGEPLNHFIQRLRLEKAANQLVDNPKYSITEIALDCGFSSSSSFARAFKDHYKVSASSWRSGEYRDKSKLSITNSKSGKRKSNIRKDTESSSTYNSGTSSFEMRRSYMVDTHSLHVDVQEMPDLHVAYIRHIGPYKGDTALFAALFTRLFKWAGARNLLQFPNTRILSVYHDNPDVTDESRLRTSVCISVPEDTEVGGEVGKMTIPGGKYAMAHFEISENEYEEAWNAVYGSWLPESGFQPDDRPCFELYLNDPKEHPEHKHIVDICIPVKPL